MVLQMLRVRALRRENARSPTSVMKEIEGSASRKSAWRRDHRRRKTRQRSRKGGQSGDAAGQNLQQLEELVAVKLLVPVFVRSLERRQQRVLAGQRLRGECARAALGRVRAGARAHARRRGCSGITSSTGLMASAEWPSMYLQREPSSLPTVALCTTPVSVREGERMVEAESVNDKIITGILFGANIHCARS